MRKYPLLAWPRLRASIVLVCYSVLWIFSSSTGAIAQSTQRGLSEDDILRALHHGVSSDAILRMVRKIGTDFDMDQTSETDLRKAGASEDLLAQVKKNTNARNAAIAPPAAQPPPAAPQAQPPPAALPPQTQPPPKVYSIEFRNSYSTPIDVAVLFKNGAGIWVTSGWYELNVGEDSEFDSTTESEIYYYAHSTLGVDKGLWSGDKDAPVGQVTDRVMDFKWSQTVTEPGGYLVHFRRYDLSTGVPVDLHQ